MPRDLFEVYKLLMTELNNCLNRQFLPSQAHIRTTRLCDASSQAYGVGAFAVFEKVSRLVTAKPLQSQMQN